MATRDLWGKNNINNNWVGQFLVVAEQVGQKASERATLKEAGGDRARVLMSDLQTQVQACSAAECSAIDFSTLCLSFSICETGVIKVPTTHGYLRVKWGMQISYTVPATQ